MTTQICRNLCDCAPREGAVVVVVGALLFALEIQTNMSLLRTHTRPVSMYVCVCMSIGFFFDSRLAIAVGMSGRIWGRIQQCLFNVIGQGKFTIERHLCAICGGLQISVAHCL